MEMEANIITDNEAQKGGILFATGHFDIISGKN